RGSEEACKIHWDKVCLDRENNCFGVRRVTEFNLALLGKLWWRMLVEREGKGEECLLGGGLRIGDNKRDEETGFRCRRGRWRWRRRLFVWEEELVEECW
ncbi:hypothetical protein L195_g053154, partial [Trifolium pratense]